MKNNESNQKTTITENNGKWSVDFQSNEKTGNITANSNGTLNITADAIRIN